MFIRIFLNLFLNLYVFAYKFEGEVIKLIRADFSYFKKEVIQGMNSMTFLSFPILVLVPEFELQKRFCSFSNLKFFKNERTKNVRATGPYREISPRSESRIDF